MTAANHVITGALIGAVITNPVVAVASSFMSHFLLDILPHFGDKNLNLKSLKFTIILISDITLSLLIITLLIALKPSGYYLMSICAIVAVSPDILWFDDWLMARRNKPVNYGNIRKFLSWIQWGERPWGICIEIIWFIAMSHILLTITN